MRLTQQTQQHHAKNELLGGRHSRARCPLPASSHSSFHPHTPPHSPDKHFFPIPKSQAAPSIHLISTQFKFSKPPLANQHFFIKRKNREFFFSHFIPFCVINIENFRQNFSTNCKIP